MTEVTTTDGLEQLEAEWAALWRDCPQTTPFQSPDWNIPWWKHLGAGQLWTLALRAEGRLVGLAPFFIHTTSQEPKRHVLLLGTGISDYLDVLLLETHQGEATSALLDYLREHHERWDVCDFQQLAPNSPLLEAEVPADWTSQLAVQEVCPVLHLPEQLPGTVPASMVQKLQYYRRRIQKESAARMESADADNFSELFESFLELHRARWSARGTLGVLEDRQLQVFHREAAQRMLRSGILRLYGLRIGPRIRASFYGFSHGKRRYFYLSGFDPELAPLSPGMLLIGHAIEEAIREGAGEFDFLRGREAYKYMWGAKGRVNYRRQFAQAA